MTTPQLCRSQNISWLLSLLGLFLISEVGSHRASTTRESAVPFKKYSWKFQEVNDVIIVNQEDDLSRLSKEFPHFLLYVYSPETTYGKQRLYETEKWSRQMKKELHPVPIAILGDPAFLNKIDQGPHNKVDGNYLYFRHGSLIPYHGRPGVIQDLKEWVWWMRWPNSEPITSQQNLNRFLKHSLVSVVYYGDKKTEEGYQNFTHGFSHFHHSHMKFGHTFKWELKKHLAGKLPCVEIRSQVSSAPQQTFQLCKELTHEALMDTLKAFKPKVHKVFHPKMMRSWFTHSTVELFVFIHHGLSTEAEKHMHVLFHQFLDHHRIQKVGEVDMRRKSGLRIADRFKFDRHIHLPGIFILKQTDKQHVYKYKLDLPDGEELDVKHLIEFERRYLEGSLTPFFKSQSTAELPKYGGNVIAFNSDTFEAARIVQTRVLGEEQEPPYLLVYFAKLTSPYYEEIIKSLEFLSQLPEVAKMMKVGVLNLARNEHDYSLPSSISLLLLDRHHPTAVPMVLPADSEVALIDLVHFVQPLVPSLDAEELAGTPDL